MEELFFIGIQYICVADIDNYHTFANSVTLVLINATEYEVKRNILYFLLKLLKVHCEGILNVR